MNVIFKKIQCLLNNKLQRLLRIISYNLKSISYKKPKKMQAEQLPFECERMFTCIQCGMLKLNTKYQNAFLMMGNTKAGKTTSALHMAGVDLIGGTNQDGTIIYKTHGEVPQEYKYAKIGEHEHNSQTEIPNIFQFQLKNKKVIGIDCPGYGDSFGCFRSISNFYFLHRVFSQIKKIKFILVIDMNGLSKNAEGLISTLVSFFNMFSQIEKTIDLILSSISLLITNVQIHQNLEQITSKYQKSKSKLGKQSFNKAYQKLKKHLLDKKKIFIFKKPQLGKILKQSQILLGSINSPSEWWSRPEQNQKIQMQKICLLMSETMVEKQEFNQQLTKLAQYFKLKVHWYLNEIENMFKQFQNYPKCLTLKKSENQLKDIQRYQQKCKHQNKQIAQLINIHGHLQLQQKIQTFQWKNIFLDIFCQFQIQQSELPIELLLMKGHLQIFIIAETQSVNQSLDRKSLQFIEKLLNRINKIFNIYINLSQKQFKSAQTMMDLLYRLYMKIKIAFQIYTVFFLSNIKQKSFEKRSILRDFYANNLYNFSHKLTIMMQFVQIKQYKIQIKYAQSLDIDKQQKNPAIYWYYREYLMKLRAQIQKMKDQIKEHLPMTQQQMVKIQYMLVTKIRTYILNILEYKAYNHGNSAIPQVMIQLIKEADTLFLYFQANSSNKYYQYSDKDKCQMIKIQQLLAYCAKRLNGHQVALKIYENLNDAYEVINYYEEQEIKINKLYQIKNKQSKNKMLEFLFNFAKVLFKYGQNDKALIKAQRALSIAQLLGSIKFVKQISSYIDDHFYQQEDQDEDEVDVEQGKINQKINQKEKKQQEQEEIQDKYAQYLKQGLQMIQISDEIRQAVFKCIQKYQKQNENAN